jgi:hypothetical protein
VLSVTNGALVIRPRFGKIQDTGGHAFDFISGRIDTDPR